MKSCQKDGNLGTSLLARALTTLTRSLNFTPASADYVASILLFAKDELCGWVGGGQEERQRRLNWKEWDKRKIV